MNDKKMATVRKLLAKAEGAGTTPQEAEAFTAKAVALMAAHGIDRAMLDDTETDPHRPGNRRFEMNGPYLMDKLHLLNCVAKPFRVKLVRVRGWNGNLNRSTTVAHLFGFDVDLDRVELLFRSLVVQMSHAVAAQRIPWGQNTAAFRRSFMFGYSATILHRLTALEQAAAVRYDAEHGIGEPQAGDPRRGTELVLRGRDAAVQASVEETYPKIKAGPSRRLSGNGTEYGALAAKRADLGQTAAVAQ